MVRIVDNLWLRSRLGAPDVTVVDPRSRTRYLSGHVPSAISVPVKTAFQPDGRLKADAALIDWLGDHGVPSRTTVAIYGDSDGQSAAMLAWILEYLGHPDVAVMGTRLEWWRKQGGELSYRPVEVAPTTFEARPRSEVRATWEHAAAGGGCCLLDTRSEREYRGEQVVADDPPGHIPEAINLPWLSFQGRDEDLFVSPAEVVPLLEQAGVDPEHEITVYCRSGLRASFVWLVLHLAGVLPRLYDGSFLDWSRRSHATIESGSGGSLE